MPKDLGMEMNAFQSQRVEERLTYKLHESWKEDAVSPIAEELAPFGQQAGRQLERLLRLTEKSGRAGQEVRGRSIKGRGKNG